ncbi:MAG: 4-alpha-glucanotransferase [Chloroflexota bacterium]
MKANPLYELARFYGIETAYHDTEGQLCPASEEALLAVLPLLGAPVATVEDVPGALRQGKQASWRRILEPVTAVWEGGSPSIEVRLPASVEGNLDGELALENGESRHCRWRMADLPVLESTEIEGIRYLRRRLNLEPLPSGYHRLTLELPASPGSLLIVAPPEAYCPKTQGKDWGVFLPLYALHTGRSWGSGDYSDLETLSDWVAGMGGSNMATLPLLPTFLGFPFDPSPHLPVSRLLWNEFYLSLEALPEMGNCPPAGELRDSPAFRQQLEARRRSELVDYREQMTLKRQVLEELARCFFASDRKELLYQFLKESPVVADYARFRAAAESQKATWGNWSPRMREGDLREGDYDEGIEQYYLYTQWLAHQQVREASRRARERGVSLYLDLPLGVHPDGYDAWREQSLFVPVSVGAPPDTVFTRGQSWGFPPLHPERIREQGYRYVAGYLRHHCLHAGILRLDHMMGLHRLFWIPRGMENSQGVYVRYHPEELYAILCLESQRHQVVIVGEDLGTVPPEVRPAMSRHGVHRMYVVQYELTTSPEAPFQPVPSDSVASVNTHDMFPFAAFWQGQDIQARRKLGILKKERARGETEARGAVKDALLAFLRNQGWLKEGSPDEAALLRACLSYLAASPARLVTVNLEDLWGETQPQNIPSTREEEPNWRRRARYSMEEFTQMPAVQETLQELNRLRKEGVPMEPEVPSPALLSEEDLYLLTKARTSACIISWEPTRWRITGRRAPFSPSGHPMPLRSSSPEISISGTSPRIP